MTTEETRHIVETVIEQMRKDLRVDRWFITVEYCRIDGENAATCTASPDYGRAVIEIDPEKHDEAFWLLFNLRHELIHVMLSDMNLYQEAVHDHVGEIEADVIDRIHTFACERNVAMVEQVLDRGYDIGLDRYMKMLGELRADA
jgi:hypothetical protein